jgi:proline-specific peptidase
MKKLIYGLIIALLTFTAFIIPIPISQPPSTSGPYGIGQRSFHWIDESRKEVYSDDESHPNRELMVYAFYPTIKSEKAIKIAQDPVVLKNFINFFSKSTRLPSCLFAGLRFFKTGVTPNAEIAKDETKFPVIVFSPGDPALPRNYTWLLGELASHGFVVVAINHTYLTAETHFPDGRIATSVAPKMKKKFAGKEGRDKLIEWKLKNIEPYAQDILFVANKVRELADKPSGIWSMVDAKKIGVMGHSFGGSAVVRAYQEDDKIICGINMDGSIRSKNAQAPFTRPFVFLMGGKSHLWNPEHPRYPFRRRKAELYAAIQKEKLNPRIVKSERYEKDENMKIATIPDVGHTTFIDTPLLLNSTLMTRLLSRYFDFALEVPAGKASNALVNKIAPAVVEFFDKHLKGKLKRETIFDRVVSIPEKIIYDIPHLPPLCDEIANLKKGFANIKDGKLYYEEEGQGIPIVLINGGPGGTHHGFHPYFSQIKDMARIIYYDQRGTGKSSKDETGKTYTVKQAVEDLESLRKELKIDRWVMLGWSYGGLLTQLYALTYPNRCSGLILVASETGIPSNVEKSDREKMFLSQAELDAIENIMKKFGEGKMTLAQVIYNMHLSGDWKRQNYYKPTKKEFIRRALYGWAPAPGFEVLIRSDKNKINLKGKFDDFEIPTLITEAKWELLWWDLNRIEVMRKNHPNAQIEVFEKSGHMIFADEPEKFFTLLRGFLKKTNKAKIVYKPGNRIKWPKR